MSAKRRIETVIFDMDGLLINSRPLWDQAEVEVMGSLGVGTRRRDELPDLLGLRISLVVDLWCIQQPWHGVDRAEATARIIRRAVKLVGASRPPLPGIRETVTLCKARGLRVDLTSALPLMMLKKVFSTFELRNQFDVLASAEHLSWSKPHPRVYPNCAAALGVDPQRCVALEDSVSGIIASKAARIRAVVVPKAENSRDPRFVLADVRLPSLQALAAETLLVQGRWRVTRSLSRRRQ